MAKKKAGQFFVEVLSPEKFRAEISGGGRSGRTSKYDSIGRSVRRLTGDTVIKLKLDKKEVQPLRQYLRKNFESKYVLKTASTGKAGTFTGFIFLAA